MSEHTAGEQGAENDALQNIETILTEVGDWATALLATPIGTMVSSRGIGRDLAAHVARLRAVAPCCQKYRGWHSATCTRVTPPAVPATPDGGDASATCCCRIVGWSRDPCKARAEGATRALDDLRRTVGLSGYRFADRGDHAEVLAMIDEAARIARLAPDTAGGDR